MSKCVYRDVTKVFQHFCPSDCRVAIKCRAVVNGRRNQSKNQIKRKKGKATWKKVKAEQWHFGHTERQIPLNAIVKFNTKFNRTSNNVAIAEKNHKQTVFSKYSPISHLLSFRVYFPNSKPAYPICCCSVNTLCGVCAYAFPFPVVYPFFPVHLRHEHRGIVGFVLFTWCVRRGVLITHQNLWHQSIL